MEKKIKIVYFLPLLKNAAVARWAENFTGNHDSKKYEVCFAGIKIEEDFKKEISRGVCVKSLENYSGPGMFFKLVNYFKKDCPDIFISGFPHINIIVAAAKLVSKTKTKIVLVEHNNPSLFAFTAKSFYRRFVAKHILPIFMKFFYRFADAMICVSQGVAEDLLSIIGPARNIKVVYNPIVNEKLYELAKEPVDDDWFLDSEIPVVLAAARLVRQKDYPTLMCALKIVIEKKKVRLAVLGEGPDRKKIEKIVQNLKISQNVKFLGFQKNPYKYIKKASILALSSLEEGFGNVIVEAMALGTPVVSTSCPSGPKEIIKNGENGILVPVQDCRSFAKAIIEVLENPILRRKISEGGKKRAQDFLVKNVGQYEEVFEKILNREKKCIVCGSNDLFYFSQKDGYNFLRCKACGLIFVHPCPDLKILAENFYSKKARYHIKLAGNLNGLKKYNKKFIKIIGELEALKLRGKLLDVGCSNGEFMFLAKKAGFEPYGVEINKDTADIAKRNGLSVFNGELKQAAFKNGYFSVIFLGDIIEHVVNPDLLLKESVRLLKKGGVIVISTPNTDCLFAKIVVSLHKWFNFPLSLLIPPYHLVLFSEGNLKRIIKKFNLEILKTEYYRCSLRHEVSGTGILQNFFKKKSWKNLALAIFVSLSYAIIFCAGVFLKPFLKKDFEMLLFVQKIL